VESGSRKGVRWLAEVPAEKFGIPRRGSEVFALAGEGATHGANEGGGDAIMGVVGEKCSQSGVA